MEKILFNAEVIRQLIMLIMNRHFEISMKDVKIDLNYGKTKLITVVINGNIEYIPKKG
ncbi:MAG: hypothetical protein RQ952_01170 [Thermoproteota archaeon]|jgi:hypothetical protein|nr:hypothetical protein [Thermoproteota archaeon]